MPKIDHALNEFQAHGIGISGAFTTILEAKLKLTFTLASILFGSATSAYADCQADIAGLMAAHKNVGPYHVSMTMVSAGKTMQNEVDVILPSSFHMNSKQMEMIITKDGAWMNMSGHWQAMPAQVAHMTTAIVDQGMAQGIKAMKNPACLGATSFQGGQFNTFTFDSSATVMGIVATSHVTMYADDKNRPVWVVVDGVAMGHKSLTTQKITYDPSIKITPPQ